MLYSCQLNFECARYALEKNRTSLSLRDASRSGLDAVVQLALSAMPVTSSRFPYVLVEAGGFRFAKGAGHERTTLPFRVALRESSLHLDCDPAESASFSSMERRPRASKITSTAPL